ncbi:MAG: phosphatidate cytidylyltransferase [Ignavibacteria bacterium]|nr:phosphatidate cytidylyltransferase [Ignavibacteria bacterium]
MRIIVGVLGIPLIIILAVYGNYYFLVFCVIVSFFCMNEFYNLFEKPGPMMKWFGGISVHKTVFLLISSLIVINFYFEHVNYVLILYFLMFVYLITDEIFKHEKHFEAIGTWMLSVVYISTPFGLLSLMASDKFIGIFGANYALISLILIWTSDTSAFFGGKMFGKHKMAERISPKKTWEGSAFGFLFTLTASVLLYLFFRDEGSLVHFLLIGLIVAVFAQIGDLFESHLKRMVKVKDSSNFIPGHGGFLDRFDSMLFAVPAVYIYLYLKSII